VLIVAPNQIIGNFVLKLQAIYAE